MPLDEPMQNAMQGHPSGAPAAHQGPERRQRRLGGDRRSGLGPRGEDHGDGVTGLEDTEERRNEINAYYIRIYNRYIICIFS